MFEPLHRKWRFYISDMLGFAKKLMAYTDGLGKEKFVASGLSKDATRRNLILLGEAATHIPERVQLFVSEIG